MSKTIAVPYHVRPALWPGRRLLGEVVGTNGQPTRYYEWVRRPGGIKHRGRRAKRRR